MGEQTGREAQPKAGEKPALVLGELPADVLAAVKAGTSILALVLEDGLADGVAKMIAQTKGMHAVVHRMPDMVQRLQRRFLENAVRWLAGVK